MIRAQWLFENHLMHVAMAKHLKNEIKALEKSSDSQQDDCISSMALSHPPLDAIYSHGSGQGSATERIALNWREEHENETKLLKKHLMDQLAEYEYYLCLYDSVMSAFPQREAWLIENHFIQSLSFSQISDTVDGPYYAYSKSTLCRHKNRVLKKADDFLNSCVSKGDFSCRPMKFVTESLQSASTIIED